MVCDGGYLWYKVLYYAHSFDYMAIYDFKIKIILVFFSVCEICGDFLHFSQVQ